MNRRSFGGLLWLSLAVFPTLTRAQAENRPPREFPEIRGTWSLDETAGVGQIEGLPLARKLVIATTPTEVSVVKDGKDPEIYRFDGTETSLRDARTGSVLDRRYRFTLVAGRLALTSRLTRHDRGRSFTNIVTDAYAAAGDVLTVERQLSVLVEPPGSLATLEDLGNNRQTIIYRRSTQAPGR
jgi:hypothetical protein